jgi:hypothetical protein
MYVDYSWAWAARPDAQPNPARKSRVGSGLHIGPSSGLILEPKGWAGPGSGLHKTQFKPNLGRACQVGPGFWQF